MKLRAFGFEVNLAADAKILDIGCGQGWAVLEAAQQGVQAYGLDVSPELLKEAQELSKKKQISTAPVFLMGRSERAPFKDNSFDVIVCTEVIEHTLETATVLTEIGRLLKKDGVCLFSFPVDYVEKSISLFDRNFTKYSGHVKQFSLNEMKTRLQDYGLKAIKTERKYFEWSVYWLIRAVAGGIPDHDRTGDRYGTVSSLEAKWGKVSYYYKRILAKSVSLKIGIPILWLGNLFFPKSYFLTLKKVQR